MKNLIFKTSKDNSGAIFIRILLGVVIFGHGAQKLLGVFGGFGFNGTMNFFVQNMELPWIVGLLVIITEFFGSLCLIIGAATRLWAIAFIVLFIGLIQTSHGAYGFYMNWLNNQKGEGIEFDLLGLGMAVSLLVTGAGKYSVDLFLSRKQADTVNPRKAQLAI